MTLVHLGRIITSTLAENSLRTALRYKEEGQWVSLTYKELENKIFTLATALIRAGLTPGDRVGIYSANRYEWAVTDFACILAGLVSVPIYSTNTGEQAGYIIEDAGISMVFVGNDTQYQNIAGVRTSNTRIISYDPDLKIDKKFTTYFEPFLSTGQDLGLMDEIHTRQEKITRKKSPGTIPSPL